MHPSSLHDSMKYSLVSFVSLVTHGSMLCQSCTYEFHSRTSGLPGMDCRYSISWFLRMVFMSYACEHDVVLLLRLECNTGFEACVGLLVKKIGDVSATAFIDDTTDCSTWLTHAYCNHIYTFPVLYSSVTFNDLFLG